MSANGRGNRSRANVDELIVAALTAGQTEQTIAETAGVSLRTVSRRLTDPAFKESTTPALIATFERLDAKR